MDELKPCPFCGGKASIGKTIDGMNWQIVCRGECRCTSAYFAQKENAVAAWNRRPATENKPLTLDQLRQMDGEPVYMMYPQPDNLNGWMLSWDACDYVNEVERLGATTYARKPEQ
ncbi:MAG: Lar family restriction alleviation protein [Faecalispora sporosphaeroides]|uniref:Lar family restriction alleviation protein n=1 Tax=Faecalispora sporosphaeroides TaxID=1549 RepID=UPI003992E2A3